jgi:siderophore synthetase component
VGVSTAEYFMERILDALLREDLFDVVSTGTFDAQSSTLRAHPAPGLEWFIPVHAHRLHQTLKAAKPWIVCNGDRITDPRELVARMQKLVDEPEALRAELECAWEHHEAVQSLRAGIASAGPASWAESLLWHDRIAALQDHPLYPTARAKVGLDVADLQRYAPEWSNSFELRWLGVPVGQLTHRQGSVPGWWPQPAELGLPPGLFPVPVHPHTALRLEPPAQAVWAPHSAVAVRPTLSVRTVAVLQHPEFHLKLPLFMRSLSFKNLRKVKPDTLHDGAVMQDLLGAILAQEPQLRGQVLLTEENCGLSVDGRSDLGCIVRRYPAPALEGCQVLPTAAFSAQGVRLAPEVLSAYLELTLRLHLTLWVRYGIALESNQQNTLVVVAPDGSVRLLLKDNDAARIYAVQAQSRLPLPPFCDPCILVEGWEAIAQMFITITLQLNLQLFFPAEQLREALLRQLQEFSPEELDNARVQELLLDPEFHPVKRLWSAGTLFSKTRTGAADINKFYGHTAPNLFASQERLVSF